MQKKNFPEEMISMAEANVLRIVMIQMIFRMEIQGTALKGRIYFNHSVLVLLQVLITYL